MAGSKYRKKILQRAAPPSAEILSWEFPDSAWKMFPAWSFQDCDIDEIGTWAFCKTRLYDEFWNTILPQLRFWETMTLNDIFVVANKQNHKVDVASLNKCARDRLDELHIEAESLHSLRISGTLRLYGYLVGNCYHIVWYDNDHGDNDTCVCRSAKRHT